jgi:hypothetical protein
MSLFHETFDKIYYINLAHRADRREHIEKTIAKLGVPVEKISRIEAEYTRGFGMLGCTKSHLKTVLHAKNSRCNTVIIFEDDFDIPNPEEFIRKMNHLMSQTDDWDVIMMSSEPIHYEPAIGLDNVIKVSEAYHASAYAVKGYYLDKLIDNFAESVRELSRLKKQPPFEQGCPYCNDVNWRKLQRVDKWYAFFPTLGKQLINYSDISEEFADRKENISR